MIAHQLPIFARLIAAMMSFALLVGNACAQTTLWQIGIPDGASAEFTGNYPGNYTIPDDWQQRLQTAVDQSPVGTWHDFNKMMVANRRQPLNLRYTLAQLPPHGLELQLGIFDSTKLVPQLSVHSNGIMAGLIQTWGVKGTKHEKTHSYQRTYRVYIPREMLAVGSNELRLDMVAQPYGSNLGMDYFSWDFLRLVTNDQPVETPVHGAVVHTGTNLTLGADGPKAFRINQHSVRMAEPLLEWMGIAHSGNFMRAPYWSNVSKLQTHRRELLEKYRDLNMQVVLNTLYLGNFKPEADGSLPAAQREMFDGYMKDLGDLVHWVEVANEPGLIGPIPFENVLSFTKYVRQSVPANVKVLGPGWAYNTWAGEAEKRRAIEDHCDAIGGHAYGLSFNNTPGGNFIENLMTYHPITDGFPKPFINTEFGSNEWHFDWDAKEITTQSHAAAFDRNMRAHVAVAQGFLQHAAFFNHQKKEFEKFSMFADVEGDDWDNPHDPLDTRAWPGVKGQESRLQTYRRLALAYCTHGSPLSWTLANRDALANQLVYVRCVNTATLKPLPGSGATANKVLLNFVNFSDVEQTVQAQVTLPSAGTWQGKRIGPGDRLGDAMQAVELSTGAGGQVNLTVTLPVRQSVQYILTPTSAQ